MRIKELRINNFTVIREAHLENLGDIVVVAGPNGVGKTKIKNAIEHIFRNNGNPPAGCSVVLEVTSQNELNDWGSQTISLPNQGWLASFLRPSKRVKTTGKFINIDSARQIENVIFEQPTVSNIGNPDEEEVNFEYAAKRTRDRFKEICNAMYRQKLKIITDLGTEAYNSLRDGRPFSASVVDDPTKPFEDLFGKLLYPKKMVPIKAGVTTFQYFDEDGQKRGFDELSSGEREVLVLTFDIFQQAPSDCVIVIDEPELHLHPELTFRLVKVLKSIGERNQFFLLTHSTDIISSAFDTGIHFLRPKKRVPSGNQILKVDSTNIGDLSLIPNLREAIGVLSLGKKLLFVEGVSTGIDRNVFATLAKSEQVDVAIVSSEGGSNLNNLGVIATLLARGLFGIELFMVRDRDGLTDAEVNVYTTKSSGKIKFLPFYEIENTFLSAKALAHISRKITPASPKTEAEINTKLVELARAQINQTTVKYVVNEIRFKAGNLDTTPTQPTESTANVGTLVASVKAKKDEKLLEYSNIFTDQLIQERIEFWKNSLEQALVSGWSDDARKIFKGKGILASIQSYLFPGKNISIWQEIINDEDPVCKEATRELRDILAHI